MEELGWVLGSIATLISGLAAAIIALRKSRVEVKKLETDYLFEQYRDSVARVKKEHEEDRALLGALQNEHTHCREELARVLERLTALEHSGGARP